MSKPEIEGIEVIPQLTDTSQMFAVDVNLSQHPHGKKEKGINFLLIESDFQQLMWFMVPIQNQKHTVSQCGGKPSSPKHVEHKCVGCASRKCTNRLIMGTIDSFMD